MLAALFLHPKADNLKFSPTVPVVSKLGTVLGYSYVCIFLRENDASVICLSLSSKFKKVGFQRLQRLRTRCTRSDLQKGHFTQLFTRFLGAGIRKKVMPRGSHPLASETLLTSQTQNSRREPVYSLPQRSSARCSVVISYVLVKSAGTHTLADVLVASRPVHGHEWSRRPFRLALVVHI